MAVIIRTYGSANRLDAIRTYISTNIRRRFCAANFKELTLTLNLTLIEKWNATLNPKKLTLNLTPSQP